MIYVSSHADPLPSLDGQLEIGAPLGEGGGGSVFEAVQVSLQRQVAVKRLHAWSTEGAEQRFREEATIMGRVAHPNIVPVLMHGDLDGAPALVMERVDGLDLALVLRGLRGGHAPPSVHALGEVLGSTALPWPAATPWWKVAASLSAQIARALDHAHRCGVLHRDLKPSNVLLSKSGTAQLTDFGIALPHVGGEDASTAADSPPPMAARAQRLSATSGNLAYCSPEELDGRASTPRSDLFSLGLIARELVSLQTPYPDQEASVAARILRIAEGRLQPLDRRLPSDLRAVLDAATALEPAGRYASADDFARDLENACEGRPISVRPETRLARYRRWWTRHGAAAGMLLGLVFLLVAVPAAVQGARLSAARQVQASADAAREHLELAVDGIGDLMVNVTAVSLKEQPKTDAQRALLLASGAQLGRDLMGTLSEHSQAESKIAARIAALRARALNNLVQIERRNGDFERAREHARELLSIQRLVPEEAVPHLTERLQLNEIIMVLREGDLLAVEELTIEALRHMDEDSSSDDELRKIRASVWNARVEAALARSDYDAAVEYGAEAVEAGRAWREKADPQLAATRELSRVLSNYGAACIEAGKIEIAGSATREALGLVRSLPATTETEGIEATLCNNVGAIEKSRGRRGPAEDAERRALDIQEAHLAARPRSVFQRFAVARTHYRIGLLLLGQSGRADELDRHFREAHDGVASLCRGASPAWSHLSLFGSCSVQLGLLRYNERDWPAAHEQFAQAVTALASAAQLAPERKVLEPTQRFAWKYYAGLTLQVQGEAGVGELYRYQAEFPDDPEIQCNVATMLCVLASKARQGSAPPSDEDELRIDEYHARAVACLKTAVDLSGLTLKELTSRAPWKPLHERSDFEALVQQLR